MQKYVFPNQSLCVGNVPQSFFIYLFILDFPPHCVYYGIIYLVLKCFRLLSSKQSRNSRLLHKASFYNPQFYRKHLLFQPLAICCQDRSVKLYQLSTRAFTKIFTQHTSNARPNASRCCFALDS